MSDEEALSAETTRRRFLRILGIGGVGGAVTVLAGVPLVGYLFSPLLQQRTVQWVRVCSLSEIGEAEPREFRIAFKGEDGSVAYNTVAGVFVIRRGEEILAFSNVCTHMGCSVRWLAWRQQILCPCHGGLYDRWGQLMGGPPSQSLSFFVSRIQDGDLYVANRIVLRGVL